MFKLPTQVDWSRDLSQVDSLNLSRLTHYCQPYPQLRSASDRAWQGLIDYFDNDGYGVDAWGSLRGPWLEYNPTAQDYNNILIHEPCNYASRDGRNRVEYFPGKC